MPATPATPRSGDSPVAVPALRLHLLHQPRLVRSDGAVLQLAEKDAALLALVVLQAPVARSQAASLLWPGGTGSDSSPSTSRGLNNLRQRVFRLARWAGRDVVTQGRALALAAGIEHDLMLSETLFLQDALAVQGELLGDHAYDEDELGLWVDSARRRWRANRADLLIGLTARLEQQDRLGEALRLASRLVSDEPLMEHASRILMRLHHRRGDRGAALAEFERCRQALYEHHGDAPSDETIELSLAISRADAGASSRPASLPLALRHPPKTVGRAAAVARAEHAWQHGGAVVLVGAAGIGKSRLQAELAQRWGLTVNAQCRAQGAASGFALLSQLAGIMAPLLRGRLDGDAMSWLDWLADPRAGRSPVQPVQAAKLVEVLAHALGALKLAGVPGVSIEDLQNADRASIDVIVAVLPGADVVAGAEPMRWLFSARDGELPAALQEWFDGRPPGLDPLVRLEPLDAAATQEFLRSLGLAGEHREAAARLHAHCGGHPLFMLQVLRQLQLAGELEHGQWPAKLPLPDDALASASQRLMRAEPAAQQMAFLAALCGADFSPALLCRLMSLGPAQLLAPWRRLEDLHIFGPKGFAHDLVREAVLSVVPKPLEPLLHREIAAALAQLGGDPMRRAQHWHEAGDFDAAAQDFRLAAELALSCGLAAQAVELLERAATLFTQVGRQLESFDCRWKAGHLMVDCTSVQDALELARDLAAQATSMRQHGMAGELMARIRIEQHDAGSAGDAKTALVAARASGDAELLARCHLRLGEALSKLGQHEQALIEFDAAAARPELLVGELPYTLADDRASVLAAMGRREEAVQVHRRQLERALAERNLQQAASSAGFCATHLSYLCRVGEAITMAQQGLALARQAGSDRGLILIDQMGLAGNLGDVGRFDEALAIGERVIRDLRQAGLHSWAVNATNDRAVMYMRLGRADLAQHLLAEPIHDAPLWVRAARTFVCAKLEQWQGRPAAQQIQRAVDMFEEGGVILDDFPHQKIALEAARVASPDQAVTTAARVISWAQAHQHLALARCARMVEIDALRRLGRLDAAAQGAQELCQLPGLLEEAFGFYLPEMLLTVCEVLSAAGANDRADGVATAAVAWIEDRALRHVPAVFRDSFRHRNAVNARLLALRSRR